MNRLVALLAPFLLFAACAELSESNSGLDTSTMNDEQLEQGYERAKRFVLTKRDYLSNMANEQPLDSIGDFVHQHLIDSIFPYWIGTEWDFNGVSQKPKKGKIACGYFVSTTLKHCGFDVERVRLAQQAASNIINTLCDPNTRQIFTNNNFIGLKEHLHAQSNGLYIIGLDNHVAFISKQLDGIFVIHASPYRVKKQPLDDSSVVKKSNYHVVANFSHNHRILKMWLKKERITTRF